MEDTRTIPEDWTNPYVLARMADCGSPDSKNSVGAERLLMVAADVFDQLRYDGEPEDIAYDAADSCVPVYTYERWLVFVDLAAWVEDVAELGVEGDDLTSAAAVALYMIFERLAQRLVEDWQERIR